jgi:hypothetical protein
VDADHRPRFAVQDDRPGRPPGRRAADRIQLPYQTTTAELVDEIGQRGDSQPTTMSDVMAAAGSMVSDVAKDMGEVAMA